MTPLDYLISFVKDNGPYAFTIEELKEWLSKKYKGIDSLTMSENILNLKEVSSKGRVYIVPLNFLESKKLI